MTAVSLLLLVTGCDTPSNSFTETQEQLHAILKQENLPAESKYTIINRIANNLLATEEYNQLIILLTGYVEENPADMYNAYWLLMTAYAYMQLEAKPMAEYYFDRIINTCQDLEVQGQSIRGAHFVSGNWIITYPPHPALPALILASAKMFPQRCLKGRRDSYRRKTKELCTTPPRDVDRSQR